MEELVLLLTVISLLTLHRLGGSIFDVDGNFNVNNTNFTKNTAIVEGGAIDNHDTSTSNLAFITSCTFNGNNSPGNGSNGNGDGAAIYNSEATLNVNSSNFMNNTANFGAIDNDPAGICTINNCNFTSNIATTGGGAIINNDGTLTVNNCTFTSNNATNGGGAIANPDGILNVTSSTFIK